MTTIRNVQRMTLPLATVLVSLLTLPACEGDQNEVAPDQAIPAKPSSPTASSISIPMDSDPAISTAVKAAIAERKAADPNVNLSVSDDGMTLTGDSAQINQLATSLTDKYSEGNEAMGSKWFCLHNVYGACGWLPFRGSYTSNICHEGKYLGWFFARAALIARMLGCGGGGYVKSGRCPTDGSCYKW